MSPRRTLGAVLVAVVPFVAACGAGQNNTTSKEHATPYVAQARVGDVLVTNVALVPTGSTTTIGGSTDATATQGYLVATIANSGTQADTLTGASLAQGQVEPTSGSTASLRIEPRSAVTFGNPELGDSGPALRVTGIASPVNVGGSLRVTFTFDTGGSATIDVPVKSPDQLGTTATSYPVDLTGSYPSPSESTSPSESSAP